MKKNKIMFMIMLILSTMIIASSENWISMWMGMEINMMSFIPMMSEKKNNKAPESKMIYFLVQSITSMMLILMIIINPLMTTSTEMMEIMSKNIMIMSLAMKMGMAPMHLWFLNIMSKMTWMNCMILMTWQKIGPMIMMSNIIQEKTSMMLILSSTIIGAIGGINQTSMKMIMAYSSINHMSWMLLCMKTESDLWMKYWLIYTIMIMTLSKKFNKESMYHVNQMIQKMKSKSEMINMTIMMLSMGGMPPFIGFLPKWMTIQSAIMKENKMMIMIMIIMSMITLYYYLRMIIPMMMMQTIKMKWMTEKKNNKEEKIMMLTNFSMPIIMIMNMF